MRLVTFGFARRVASYKRLNLLVADLRRALALPAAARPLQARMLNEYVANVYGRAPSGQSADVELAFPVGSRTMSDMPSVPRVVRTLVLIVSFTGCAPAKTVSSPVEPSTALVYAYVDLGKSPSSWQQATILCRDKNGKEGWWRAMRIDGSLFYVENVPMGTCWMPAAVAVVALRGDYHYDLGKTAETNPTTTRVTRPGAVFMGAYRFEPKGDDSFRLTPIRSPSEKEVLNKLRAHTDGTPWDRVVAERLRRL